MLFVLWVLRNVNKMTHIYHFYIIQNSFTALKILPAASVYLTLTPQALQTLPPLPLISFDCHHSFVFFRMSYRCSHTVCRLYGSASFFILPFRFIHVYHVLIVLFFKNHWKIFYCMHLPQFV